MLKKFIQTALLLVVLFTTVHSYAQVSQAPDGIQFQALATDANGHPAAGRVIYVKDAIVAKTATGTIVYSETFKVTASSAGIFTIVLGKGTYASGVSSIANIDWANGPFFLNLKIAVEPTVPNAGWNVNNEYVDLGTSQFWSVPYALYAGNVKGADTKLNISDTAAMLKPYFTAINLKANIESPTFTGTVKGITKAMVGLANVDNTSDIDKPVSTATKTALDLKANAADVATALALKANATDVTTALDLKVDKVTGKALSTNDYTTAEKTKLAAITGTNTGDQDLSALAVAADVNAALALKANGANVANSLALKANTADVTAALDTKVSSADATAALALKANTADVNAALALKANGANVANSLALKANTMDVNTALALKADDAVVTTQLAAKENASSKSVNLNTDAASDVKYPSVKAVKTYVDAQVAGATIADADANTKGKIQLTGDLGGTAAAPTVPGLALKENASNKSLNIATDGASDVKYPSVKSVKTYVDAQVAGATIADADANTKGKIQLTGDLGGTAAAPTVPGLALKAPLASPTFTGTVTTDIINTGALSATSVTAPTYASAPKTLTYTGSTINWNPAQGLNAAVTLTQNSTLSFTAAPPVGSYGTVVLTQDATGNRTITLPTINGVANKVLGSASTSTVALSTAANAKDILNFYFDGTSCYWNIGQGYGSAASSASTNLATSVSGTLAVANGGTGATTLTGLIKGSGTNVLTAAVAGTDYQAPISLTTNGSGAATLSGTTLNIPSTTNYTLPTATASTLGGVIVGTNLSIDGSGVLSASVSPTFTGAVTAPVYASTPQVLTAGTSINWNPALGLNASVTLAQNSTLSFTSTPTAGAYGTLVVTQGTGGNFTLTLPSTTNKVLGSTSATTVALSTAAGAKDIVNFYYDGINCYWNVGQGYGTAATTASTNLATSVSGTLPVANGGTGAITLTGLVKGTGTSALTAAVAGTDYLAPNGSAASLTNFPTFNQNTTGNAATVTTNANLTGDVTSVGNTATVVKINGTSLASLSTGILKNTTSTGVPTIAVAGTDYQMPINLTTTGTGAATLSGTTLNIPAVSSTVNASTISGTVGIANGGTGLSTTPANGQIDIGNGTGFTRATLTAGTAITITNTAGTITIAAAVRPTTDQFTATSAHAVSSATFTLSQTPLNTKVWMFINGIRTNNSAYSISGTTVTYTAASNNNYTIVVGDRIQFDYAY